MPVPYESPLHGCTPGIFSAKNVFVWVHELQLRVTFAMNPLGRI
jgi:hypothetical protein